MDTEAPLDPGPDPGRRGPAQLAARRGTAPQVAAPGERGYPPLGDHHDPTGDRVALAATRALVTVTSRAEAARVLHTAVTDMGARVVPARLADQSALSVDVSLGVGEPLVVVADPTELASLRLAHHLPALVEDALSAASRCDHHQRQRLRATTDPLTGVARREAIGPRLALAAPGDVVCRLDLGGLRELNDTLGHETGDRTLRALGRLLRESVHANDFAGRYGGDDFLLLLAATPVPRALERAQSLAASWVPSVSHGTGVSVGLAPIDDDGAVPACRAADKALHRAKRLGDSRVEVATADDYLDSGQADP